MRIAARYEVAAELRTAYFAATRAQRTSLLDHLCAVTGYNRKYAIAVLRGPGRKVGGKRHRRRRYGPRFKRVLRPVWEASGWICAERLKPELRWLAERLEHHGVVELDEGMRTDLTSVSIATLKRLMRELDVDVRRRRQSTTRPGSLRREVPVAIGVDADRPGFVEIDLVAHCGASGAGEFVYTLCATDIATGWTERVAILGKSHTGIVVALERVRTQMPFAVKAIHSDNGSEFLNDGVLQWCRRNAIAFSRSRPYHKNDNAHVEQRNWSLVRKLIGYARFETAAQRDRLNALYTDLLRVHNNGFQPTMRLVGIDRSGPRPRKRYDIAETPARRVVATLPSPRIQRFLAELDEVNPLALTRRVNAVLLSLTATTEDRRSA